LYLKKEIFMAAPAAATSAESNSAAAVAVEPVKEMQCMSEKILAIVKADEALKKVFRLDKKDDSEFVKFDHEAFLKIKPALIAKVVDILDGADAKTKSFAKVMFEGDREKPEFAQAYELMKTQKPLAIRIAIVNHLIQNIIPQALNYTMDQDYGLSSEKVAVPYTLIAYPNFFGPKEKCEFADPALKAFLTALCTARKG
jgi:hypothetical protein